jgi:hypothetical protein
MILRDAILLGPGVWLHQGHFTFICSMLSPNDAFQSLKECASQKNNELPLPKRALGQKPLFHKMGSFQVFES